MSALDRLTSNWTTAPDLTTTCTCQFVRDLTADHRPHQNRTPAHHAKGKKPMTTSTTTRYALRLFAVLVAYAIILVTGIALLATSARAQESVCDITATVDSEGVLTITHLSPLPGPGVVTVNGEVYRSWTSDGQGNMVLILDVAGAGADEVTIVRDVPPAQGQCVITIPLTDELDQPSWEKSPRWGHHLSDRCGRACGHEVRQWAHESREHVGRGHEWRQWGRGWRR